MKIIRFCPAVALLFISFAAAAVELVHDADYYVLEAQNSEKWAKDDKLVDQKLTEFRNKNGGKPPNIIYILVDDMGFGDMGIPELNAIRGYKTPAINKLADESMRFARMYTEPSCTPTRAAFMTGRLAMRVGMADTTVDIDGSGLAARRSRWPSCSRMPVTTRCTSASGTSVTSWSPGRTTRVSILPPSPSTSRAS